ncbi:MAG TPA: T9SS type A sorting domain-containing protein [Vicingaceae bacterium]
MKKIYLLLATTFVAGASFAQYSGQQAINQGSKSLVIKANANQKTPTDTTGLTTSGAFLPEFAQGGQIFQFGYTGGGFVYGNNADSLDWCAQGYSNVNNATFNVEGILIWAAAKDNSNAASLVTVNLHSNSASSALTDNGSCNGTPSGTMVDGPGAVLKTENILLSAIDTAFPNITYVPFTAPLPSINGDALFYVSIDSRNLQITGDTVGFFSDADTEGLGMAFHELSALGASGLWGVTDMIFGCGLDNNIAAFAVIDDGTVGINDKEFYNDMQLSAFPNPANNQATISFRLNKEMSNITIKMIDLAGKEVLNINKGTLAAGLYNETVDATNLEAGIYFYSIIANGTRFTKKLTISK